MPSEGERSKYLFKLIFCLIVPPVPARPPPCIDSPIGKALAQKDALLPPFRLYFFVTLLLLGGTRGNSIKKPGNTGVLCSL